MKFYLGLAVAFGILVSIPAVADEPGQPRSDLLHDNGSFANGDGAVVCDQLPFGTGNTSSPNGANGTLGAQSQYLLRRNLDDFTVPPGESWTLSTLRWRVYQTGTLYDALIDDARVRVWASDPVSGGTPLWGDMTTNRAVNSFFTNILRTPPDDLASCSRAIKSLDIDLSGLPSLPPGRYWVEVGVSSSLPGGLFSPPTEPRQPGDNARQTDFSGAVSALVDGGSGLALDFPFQLYGTVVSEVTRACVLPNGTCTNATWLECEESLDGDFNFFYSCAQLGACCDNAVGQCSEQVGPMDCTGPGMTFSAGAACSALPGCGLINGACCFPSDTPSDCQSFTRGINCTNTGGIWHPGNCTQVSCNDYCETPADLLNGDTSFDNFGYGTERATTPNSCNHDPFVGMNDLWFRYVSTLAAPGGNVQFSLCQSTNFKATIQVYRVDGAFSCDDLNASSLAAYCDVEGCGIAGGPGRLTVPADPGDEFIIRIGGYDGAQGGGTIRVTPIEAGFGACCLLDGICQTMSQAACEAGPNLFTPAATCEQSSTICGLQGACCRGVEGCNFTYEGLCDALGGLFLGIGTPCGAPDDCDGDGETNVCALASGQPDCNTNTIPDSCDINVALTSTDCDLDGTPDECQPQTHCCHGDTNRDSKIDGRDIELFVEHMVLSQPSCFTQDFCRVDMNDDFVLDEADVAAFVDAVLDGGSCPIVIHSTVRLLAPLPGSPYTRKVFMYTPEGDAFGSYDAVVGAQSDSFGYRDGTTDGRYVYFGWTTGVARHDADGSNGVQIIFGPTPGNGVTWRALAYDPTGDNGNGSFWTQSFTSDLLETTLDGQLLHQFPNDLILYGLTYDYTTGMLWGHAQSDPTGSAAVVEIDPENGQPTGVSFPSTFGVSGGSLDNLALHGGLEMDEETGLIFGLLQGAPDAMFCATREGNLAGPLTPNPRTDIEMQTESGGNLGLTTSRP